MPGMVSDLVGGVGVLFSDLTGADIPVMRVRVLAVLSLPNQPDATVAIPTLPVATLLEE